MGPQEGVPSQLGAELHLFPLQDEVGGAHGAHLPAHGAGVPVGGRGALEIGPGLVRVHGDLEHGLPVHLVPGLGHAVVQVPGMGDALGDVRRVGGDPGGDDPLLHVVGVRQAEVLCRGHVAEEIRPAGRGDGPADGGGDVVIPRENVGDQGAQDVEGGLVADPLFQAHVGGDLVHGHVAGALDHHLDVLVPGPLGQGAQLDELGDLAGVGAVVQAAGAEGIPQADGHVELPEDVQHVVKILVEGVLVAGHLHPGKQQGAPPGDDVHLPLVPLEGLHRPAVQAGVDGHEVHPFLGVGPDHPQEVLGGDLQQVLFQVADGVVHGDGADHSGGHFDELPAEGVGLAIVGQVHDGLRPEAQGHADLVHLHLVIVGVPGDPQVYVDLGTQPLADPLGAEGGVTDVGGDGHLPQGHPLPEGLRLHVFLFRHGLHLRGDDALLGRFHLGAVCSHGPHPFLS